MFKSTSAREPDLLVIGSGLFGLTVARLAAVDGFKVSIVEKRNHPGGNSWSEVEPKTGIEVHKYGSHLFHTSNEKVWQFVNQFTEFNSYQHHVFSKHNGKTYSLPINLKTINDFFHSDLTPSEAERLIRTKAAPFTGMRDESFEGRALASVGKELYEAFFRNYTLKQWDKDPRLLPAEVISRLPLRFSYNSRYFNDKFEGLPSKGYHGLILELLGHENISIELGLDYFSSNYHQDLEVPKVYTGPIDKYFSYHFGELSWRTLDFEWEILEDQDFQGCSVMNYADNDVAFTRIHEFKHLHPERNLVSGTVIAREFSRMSQGSDDEPFYPVNAPDDRAKLLKYRKLISGESSVFFGGRLGSYQYLDMHMAIASAMSKYENEISSRLRGGF